MVLRQLSRALACVEEAVLAVQGQGYNRVLGAALPAFGAERADALACEEDPDREAFFLGQVLMRSVQPSLRQPSESS